MALSLLSAHSLPSKEEWRRDGVAEVLAVVEADAAVGCCCCASCSSRCE